MGQLEQLEQLKSVGCSSGIEDTGGGTEGRVWSRVLCEAGLCTCRAPHQVYQTVVATGLNTTDTRDQVTSGSAGPAYKDCVTTQCPLRTWL